ncbi:hypothetical protein COB18_03905 [Candidatus Kaiserbacteria bacterium]|nr:MAG: hypothetical protein COB80_02230 [Candidatus Kaiserbacteria bacterium]PCI89434.1 MAG: hypothetical protein COB18_03905 [Candidatus Kaiserbacteria bacterium]
MSVESMMTSLVDYAWQSFLQSFDTNSGNLIPECGGISFLKGEGLVISVLVKAVQGSPVVVPIMITQIVMSPSELEEFFTSA